MSVKTAWCTQGPIVGIQTSGPCRIFQTMMKRQGWNNCRVVEYPVVNVMDVSNI